MFEPYLRVFHLIWVLGARGGGGSLKGLVHNLLKHFFTLDSSKIDVFETYFFDIVVTQNDHPSHAKYVLGRNFYVFHLIWVLGAGGGVSPKGLVYNLFKQFFTLGSSEIEVFEAYLFFLIPWSSKMTIQDM